MSVLAQGDHTTKLLLSFPRKDEVHVKRSFHMFNLDPTSFELEYATVKPNRWENYRLFANCDLPFVKRLRGKKK